MTIPHWPQAPNWSQLPEAAAFEAVLVAGRDTRLARGRLLRRLIRMGYKNLDAELVIERLEMQIRG